MESQEQKQLAMLQNLDGVFEEKIRRARRQRDWIVFLVQTVSIMLAVYLLLTQVIGIMVVRGDSMSPTVNDGDVMLIWRLSGSYKSGDVVFFSTPASETALVKRVIAGGGETVEFTEDGYVLVDDGFVDESYLAIQGITAPGAAAYPLTVDDRHYFVMGDNRTAALDSRDASIGLVPEKKIIGKMVFLFRLGGR